MLKDVRSIKGCSYSFHLQSRRLLTGNSNNKQTKKDLTSKLLSTLFLFFSRWLSRIIISQRSFFLIGCLLSNVGNFLVSCQTFASPSPSNFFPKSFSILEIEEAQAQIRRPKSKTWARPGLNYQKPGEILFQAWTRLESLKLKLSSTVLGRKTCFDPSIVNPRLNVVSFVRLRLDPGLDSMRQSSAQAKKIWARSRSTPFKVCFISPDPTPTPTRRRQFRKLVFGSVEAKLSRFKATFRDVGGGHFFLHSPFCLPLLNRDAATIIPAFQTMQEQLH